MRVAILSDVHGNAPALDAVLAAIRAAGADVIACLGDLAWKGPAPAECVARIRDLGCACVQGNGDLYLAAAAGLADPQAMPARAAANWEPALPFLRWHVERLSRDDLAFLAGLPLQSRLRDEQGREVVLAHGTPADRFAGIMLGGAPDGLDDATRDARAAWLAVGHTHVPLVGRWGDTVIVNPGAVGFSLDRNPLAAFALVDTATGSVDLRRLPYDTEAAVALAAARDFAFPVEEYRRALATGTWPMRPWAERARGRQGEAR